MAFAPALFAAASTIIPAVGAFSEGQYQAAVARNNATIAEQNAARASERMQLEQMRSDKESAAEVATAEALQSARGISPLSRSALGTRKRIYQTGREQAGDIISAGTQESRNFLQDAANFRGEAQQANKKGWFAAAEGAVKLGSQATGGNSSLTSLIGGSKSTKKRFN